MSKQRREKGSSIQRVLEVLEQVATAEQPPTPTELGLALDIPKPSAHRLCQLLEQQGFLQRRLSGRGLLPGPRLHKLSLGVLANSRFRAQRHAILRSLSKDIGETCNITIPDGSEMIYFDRMETHWPMRVQLPIGSRVPLYCTASGKLYLSTLPSSQRKRVIANLQLEQRAPNTITDPVLLESELQRIRLEQVGVDNEEFLVGMTAIAVPIKDGQQHLCATLAVHAPSMRMPLMAARAQIPRMRQAAEELSTMLEEEKTDLKAST